MPTFAIGLWILEGCLRMLTQFGKDAKEAMEAVVGTPKIVES